MSVKNTRKAEKKHSAILYILPTVTTKTTIKMAQDIGRYQHFLTKNNDNNNNSNSNNNIYNNTNKNNNNNTIASAPTTKIVEKN